MIADNQQEESRQELYKNEYSIQEPCKAEAEGSTQNDNKIQNVIPSLSSAHLRFLIRRSHFKLSKADVNED